MEHVLASESGGYEHRPTIVYSEREASVKAQGHGRVTVQAKALDSTEH